jgi:hypothetical protein
MPLSKSNRPITIEQYVRRSKERGKNVFGLVWQIPFKIVFLLTNIRVILLVY